MNLIAERVKVTDQSGHQVDIAAALNAPLVPAGDAADEDEDEDEAAPEIDAATDATADEAEDTAKA